MLSLTLERTEVRLALKESPPGALTTRLKSVDRALMALRRELPAGCVQPMDVPASLLRAVQRAMDALADDTLDLNAYPLTRLLMFNLSRWVRADAWYHPDDFRYFAESMEPDKQGRNIRVQLSCLDPARYLKEVLGGYGPHVRFSGTLSPLGLYQSLHGQQEASSERVESSFRPDQLATLIVHDLPVYYRQRQRTLPRLAELIVDIIDKRAGNYLVALPSFDYLQRLVDQLSEAHPDLTTVVQTPSMSEQARTDFLQQFQNDGQTRVGIIVLGGVFSESVDFSHAPLAGVISVGVGLPPNNAYRQALVSRFDDALGPGAGDTVTFQQPAMTKVLQMAGRLLRGPDDRGILCLIDDRFLKPEFQRFFPRHWQPEPVTADQVGPRLENFWQQASHRPRLPATIHPIPP